MVQANAGPITFVAFKSGQTRIWTWVLQQVSGHSYPTGLSFLECGSHSNTPLRSQLCLLPPQHVDKLLYDLDRCGCEMEWRCVPHDACFIHDSCFCKGSGSFPPIKPQRPSWAQYSYDWYCELAASLALHPHSPLPRFGSEVEPHIIMFGLSDPRS